MATKIKVWECKGELKWSLTTDPFYDEEVTTREEAEQYALESLCDDLNELMLRGDWDGFKSYFSVTANCIDEVDPDE